MMRVATFCLGEVLIKISHDTCVFAFCTVTEITVYCSFDFFLEEYRFIPNLFHCR